MDWHRAPLRPEDYAAIDGVRWRAVSKETAIAVAEGWNAGLDTKPMADAMRVSPATYRMLLGKLTQIGVKLRPAKARAASTAYHMEQQIVAAAPARAQPAPAPEAMRRLAEFDPVVRRALELREQAA